MALYHSSKFTDSRYSCISCGKKTKKNNPQTNKQSKTRVKNAWHCCSAVDLNSATVSDHSVDFCDILGQTGVAWLHKEWPRMLTHSKVKGINAAVPRPCIYLGAILMQQHLFLQKSIYFVFHKHKTPML